MRDNYVFFCPHAPIHLSMSHPRGIAPRLTASILRGLKGRTLIDVEGVVDIEKGMLKSITDKSDKAMEIDQILNDAEEGNTEQATEATVITEEEVLVTEEVATEEVVKETTAKKGAKKAADK